MKHKNTFIILTNYLLFVFTVKMVSSQVLLNVVVGVFLLSARFVRSQQQRSAFTAIKTDAQGGRARNVLVFQEVITNIGNHFSSSTNKFTCQYPGIYQFMFTLSVGCCSDPCISLLKNDQMIVSGTIRTMHSNNGVYNGVDLAQGGNSAILELQTGDTVWLAFTQTGRRRVDSTSNRYTSFSGILLYSS